MKLLKSQGNPSTFLKVLNFRTYEFSGYVLTRKPHKSRKAVKPMEFHKLHELLNFHEFHKL